MPSIKNVLDILPENLLKEVISDAKAVLKIMESESWPVHGTETDEQDQLKFKKGEI